MIALLLFYFDIIATFSAVQGRSITGCSPDEVLNNCGNLCELTCEMVTGIPRPCSPACGCPACVCKENTYRLNGSCVPMEVCEKYVQDGSSEGSGESCPWFCLSSYSAGQNYIAFSNFLHNFC
ncbi:hypothetical protein Y032_0278g1139 [Ancylostoma ceylanicum]|uniref:TIL domain-containing protein n=1 Tax=Ancylostoma ceylanicum TaxID=53326 RepID=A0A016S727_9BILA|nr:hypothetical protein Y032_0278g1139 [Ancylostoma ceylanicum]